MLIKLKLLDWFRQTNLLKSITNYVLFRRTGVNSKLDLSIAKSLDEEIFKKDSKHRLTLRFTNERFGGAVDYPWKIIKLNDR